MSGLDNAIASLQEDLNSAQMMMESDEPTTRAAAAVYADQSLRMFLDKFDEASGDLNVELSRIRCKVFVAGKTFELTARSF